MVYGTPFCGGGVTYAEHEKTPHKNPDKHENNADEYLTTDRHSGVQFGERFYNRRANRIYVKHCDNRYYEERIHSDRSINTIRGRVRDWLLSVFQFKQNTANHADYSTSINCYIARFRGVRSRSIQKELVGIPGRGWAVC